MCAKQLDGCACRWGLSTMGCEPSASRATTARTRRSLVRIARRRRSRPTLLLSIFPPICDRLSSAPRSRVSSTAAVVHLAALQPKRGFFGRHAVGANDGDAALDWRPSCEFLRQRGVGGATRDGSLRAPDCCPPGCHRDDEPSAHQTALLPYLIVRTAASRRPPFCLYSLLIRLLGAAPCTYYASASQYDDELNRLANRV
uniref:Uncharacterized protein n=1 Tax=Plectus sambesii TaxID=2011161 RepID=A0A914V855_9BILA